MSSERVVRCRRFAFLSEYEERSTFILVEQKVARGDYCSMIIEESSVLGKY